VENYSFTNVPDVPVQKTKIFAVISADGYAKVIINLKTIYFLVLKTYYEI